MSESDAWVNAVITVVEPLDVGPNASATEKWAGAIEALERLGLSDDAVADVSWSVVRDGEPIE